MHKTEASLVKLRGQLERVTYENEESGYTVAKVRVFGRVDLVTIVGSIPAPAPGEVLEMSGEWNTHPTFGDQFKVVFCTCSVPATAVGIERYLGGGLIKGIGPKMAKRIVAAFGEKTLDVIEESTEQLQQIEGIGEHRVKIIRKAWVEQKEIRSVMLFLQSHGISAAYATKIYKKYGNESIAIVKKNPYRLAHDIFGIGFLIADKIAQKLGFDEKSPLRAEAGILFVLLGLTEKGHVYFPYGELITKSQETLQIEEEILSTAISTLISERKIIIEELKKNGETKVGVFLSAYYLAEVRIADMLKIIRDTPKKIKDIYKGGVINHVQKKLSISLAEKQEEAINASLNNKVLVITGGPGTGKTTIIKSILEIISLATKKILLAAPTGRAAKRMSEATEREAKTIHRLLEFNPVDGRFKRNEENTLSCDLIAVDESSMIDTLLMSHLLKAIPQHAILILIGDINQLPSVGPGSVLKDIIKSNAIKVVELNEIFRQAQTSKIIVNAHKIIRGKLPEIDNEDETDFYFISEDDQEKIAEKILLMVKKRIPKKFNFDSTKDIQVLTPMNRGTVGTIKMNDYLQDALNPLGFEIVQGGRKYRVGDKVMQIRNNYDKSVFNGDIGFIADIDTKNQSVLVNIDGNEISYEYSELDELVLAYAISIHKSQGSEYPVVIIPIIMAHYMMLQRNLVYTGITRGKKLVIVIGSKKAIFMAVNNNKTIKRNTWLQERLKNAMSF